MPMPRPQQESRSGRVSTVSVIGCLLLGAVSAQAAIWRVERDGSGQFIVIKDAVNAAASGDTILLGPGRFDEHGPFQPGTVTIYDAYVGVDDIDVTFIGSGQGVTIVGPEIAPAQTQEIGFVLASEAVNTVSIQDLTLENLDKGLTAERVRVLCERVTFRESDTGALLYQSVASMVFDSEFDACYSGVASTAASHDLKVYRSTFRGAFGPAVNCGGGGQRVELRDLTVTDSNFGFNLTQGTTASIKQCLVQVGGNLALYVSAGSTVRLEHVGLRSEVLAASITGTSSIAGFGNVFEGGTMATLEFRGLATSTLHDCDIIKGTGPSVVADNYATVPVDIDLRNNYWGTTDADSIAAWIIDANDNHNPPLDPNYGTVLFEPFRSDPIPIRTTTLGELKAKFGGH